MKADETLEIVARIHKIVFKEPEDGPDILYHYTDFEGLKGILKSHKLLATSIRALNDGSELTYAEKVVREHFDTLSPDSDFSKAIKIMRKKTYAPTFVTCFCEDGDLLSMWRWYAGHGGGFCLGFRRDLLSEMIVNRESDDGLFKMYYGSKLPEHLSSAGDLIHEMAFSQHEEDKSDQYLIASILAATMFDFIKHDAFKEEKEWRLIRSGPNVSEMHFRSGHSLVKPFVELGMPNDQSREWILPLRTVRFGPTLRQQETKQAIEWMLQKYGYTGVDVEPSDLPYRL